MQKIKKVTFLEYPKQWCPLIVAAEFFCTFAASFKYSDYD